MKVVFLDLDGVLNSLSWYERRGPRPPERDHFDYAIDPATIARLNRLCAATGARIVFASTWRGDVPVRQIQADFARVGCTARVLGKTPHLPHQPRGAEIRRWLAYHPLVESFVILDDDDDMEELLPHLVQTNRSTGLTDADVERALAILAHSRYSRRPHADH